MEPFPDPVVLQSRLNLHKTQLGAKVERLKKGEEDDKVAGEKRSIQWTGPNARFNAQRELAQAKGRAAEKAAQRQRCEEQLAHLVSTGRLLWRREDQQDYVGDSDARSLYTMCRRAAIVDYELPIGGTLTSGVDLPANVRGSL
jgi:hypothetical protein